MSRLVVDQSDRVGPWVVARAGGFYAPGSGYAMGVERGGELIAGVLFDHYYAGGSVQMHIAAEPGAHWLTWERLNLAFRYPFEYLQVKKIIGVVREDNKAARRYNEHVGFTLETRITDACPGGDLLIYTMIREQCRFLGDGDDKTTNDI